MTTFFTDDGSLKLEREPTPLDSQKHAISPRLQGTSFTYWSDVPSDSVEIYVGEWRGAYTFPTNDGLTDWAPGLAERADC